MQMKREMDTCRSQLEQSQKDLAAWKFTPDRYLLAVSTETQPAELRDALQQTFQPEFHRT